MLNSGSNTVFDSGRLKANEAQARLSLTSLVMCSSPPYSRLVAVGDQFPKGTIVAIPPRWFVGPGGAEHRLRLLRDWYKVASLLMLDSGDSDTVTSDVVHEIVPMTRIVPAVDSSDGSLDDVRLRTAVSDQLSVSLSILFWLGLRCQSPLVRPLSALQERSGPIERRLQGTGFSVRTLHRRCRDAGLPTPASVGFCGWLARAVLALQSPQRPSVEVVGRAIGYSDGSYLSHTLRSLGETADSVRKRLGWEWLVAEALSARGHCLRRAQTSH